MYAFRTCGDGIMFPFLIFYFNFFLFPLSHAFGILLCCPTINVVHSYIAIFRLVHFTLQTSLLLTFSNTRVSVSKFVLSLKYFSSLIHKLSFKHLLYDLIERLFHILFFYNFFYNYNKCDISNYELCLFHISHHIQF